MKIAFLSLYSGHINRGVETWTREMASRLDSRGQEVLVLQGDKESSNNKYKTQVVKLNIIWKLRPGESILRQLLSEPYWLSLNLSFTVRCLLHLMKFKPDIVLPGNGGVQTLLIRIFSWIFGWKMVVVGHAGMGAPDKWNMLMRPDYYVFPSIRSRGWAESLVYSKGLNVVNIPHGIDLKKFSSGVKKVNIDLERPIILCVASLDPFKRVDLAVRAVSKMRNGSLMLIGGDRNEGGVDKLANTLLGNKRYLKVRVKPDEIPSYYASSDVFTLPSDEFEAFGIAYLEAMASGLPVVATNDKLRKEVVGESGILIDPTDIGKYSRALEKALKTDWGDRPRKQAEKFSWDKIVSKYENLFEKIIAN